MHVPVLEPFNSPNHRLLDADKMQEILNKYKNPIAVFQGHYHGAKITQKGNILYVSCPSMVTYPNAFRMISVTNYKNLQNCWFLGLRFIQEKKKIKMQQLRLKNRYFVLKNI